MAGIQSLIEAVKVYILVYQTMTLQVSDNQYEIFPSIDGGMRTLP